MESIFYAALALHIAGKPINKENIIAVLKAAGTPINEPALDGMAAFVETIETNRNGNNESFDPRVIKLLSSDLAHHKVQTEQVEALLTQLTRSASPVAEVDETMAVPLNEVINLTEIAGDGEMLVEVGGGRGRYIYGIAAGGETIEVGQIGIGGSLVYTIPYQDICAIVHNCHPEPYESKDDEVVKTWVEAHHRVVDEAMKRFATIIPLGFDTIIRPPNDVTHPDRVVRDWLKGDYDRLTTIMEKIKGSDEYGVQIFYDAEVISRQVSEQSDEVRQIKKEMTTKSPGMAYMYRQKLEKVVKSVKQKLADEWFNDFYGRIKRHSDDIVVEKTKKVSKDKVMLLNLSCLVIKEKVGTLGEELEGINNMEGFSVRFSGPWPPYSFVAKPLVHVGEE